MLRAINLLALLVICAFSVECTHLRGSTDIDQIRHDYLIIEKKAWAIVNQINAVNNQRDEDLEAQRKGIIDGIVKMYKKFAFEVLSGDDDFNENHYLILKRFYEWQLLEMDLMNVHKLFGAFKDYLDRNEQFDVVLASLDFAETALKDPHWPLNDTLDQIENIMINQGLYYKAVTQAKQTTCTYGLSAQQIVYQLYNAISITELKGYSMMQFSWMLLSTYGKGNFTTESQLMRNSFEKRINKTQNVLQQVMMRADREVWRCDPSNNRHVEGSTYLQVTRLLQGYIENEVDMNADKTCRENCAYYQHGVRQESCFKDLYCSKQAKCNGEMYDCQYVDSDMWVCPASSSSNRRYEYIEYESGKVLGEKKYCKRGQTKVDSWWRWLFWHCSYCFCICDDSGANSDRYISMRETSADISKNMVVTGVRFIKKNRIIHLQVQQGKLLPRGKIDNTTLEWIEPSNFRLLDGNVKSGIDYHTFSYPDRSIDLDDLKAPDGYVITGLKFRKVGSHLNLEATVTEINFKTGEIIEPSVQISNDKTENSDERRTEVLLKNPHIPIKTTNPSIPMSWSNQFVKLQASDYSKDAAQTTVPFFDAQPCVSTTPTPLSGIGLFLKGQNLFGGFITPKLFTYDLGPHIQKPTA